MAAERGAMVESGGAVGAVRPLGSPRPGAPDAKQHFKKKK